MGDGEEAYRSFAGSLGGLSWLVNLELQQKAFPARFLCVRMWPGQKDPPFLQSGSGETVTQDYSLA